MPPNSPDVNNLNCLFVPPCFPKYGNVYYEHFVVASEIFNSVIVLTNLSRIGRITPKVLRNNSIIYEGKENRDHFRKIDTLIMLLNYLIEAKYIIKKHHIDLIYAHGIKWAGFISAIIAKLFNKPLILFIHSATPERERAFHLRVISKFAINSADKVYFASKSQCKNYIEKFNILSYHVIGNPVDTELFNIDNDGLLMTNIDVLFAGRPTVEKGFPILLELIEKISKKNISVKFTILTDTKLLSQHNKNRLLKYSTFVDLMHYQNKEEYCQIINRSSFLISLSQFESFSYVIAETLACGKPVISTSCDGSKELINSRNGILVPIDNLEEAYKGLLWMIENYSLFDANLIRDEIVRKYSSEIIKNKIENNLRPIFNI